MQALPLQPQEEDTMTKTSNNSKYVCDECHILFTVGEQYILSEPDSNYRILISEIGRPKAICPKCKRESPYMIRIENDAK